MTSQDDRDACEVALVAARAAGAAVLPLWHAGVEAGWKARRDPVTAADRVAESVVRALIAETFPDDVVVGEEGPTVEESGIEGQRRWYVDPVDGTTNFLKRRPRWAVSVGFCDARDRLAAGVVHAPVTAETYAAVRGGGIVAGAGEEPAHPADALADVLLAVGALRGGHPGDVAAMQALDAAVLSVRMTGCTALDLCDVAAGRADAFWTSSCSRWDLAAGALIAAEAGALVTGMDGLALVGPAEQVLAAGPDVHDALLALIARAQSGAAAGV